MNSKSLSFIELVIIATATQDAEKDDDLYPFKKPSLLANIKFDLDSEKPVSVLIISCPDLSS